MKTIFISELLKIPFCPPFASDEFYKLLIQFCINLLVLLFLSRGMYYSWNRKAEYLFAQVITGIIVFMICAMLRWVQLELGLVLGLFAIFAIIRFRTLNVPVKEMAYLFMVVGISAINALLQLDKCLPWVIFANIILILVTYIMEKAFFSNKLSRRTIAFSNTELLKPSNHPRLLQELRALTELNIIRFEIGKVDYIKNNAQIRIFFTDGGNGSYNDEEPGTNDD
jgi:predicted membrane channel-forming protein YqfA (hemolysin III family)